MTLARSPDEATPLDAAHAAMAEAEAASEDGAQSGAQSGLQSGAQSGAQSARLRFYERFADAELCLLLAREAQGDAIEPRLFDLEDGPMALVFDRAARMVEFTGEAAPHATLSGRAAAALLTGRGIGLGLNLGVAPSAILIPPAAVDWLAETLAHAPQEARARPRALHPPGALPRALLEAIDAKLPGCVGLARRGYLAGVTYEGGRRAHLLAFVDAREGAEDALARAMGEALAFSGIEAGEMDVVFLRASDPLSARLARVGLRLEWPEPEARPAPTGPGLDPARPPRLR